MRVGPDPKAVVTAVEPIEAETENNSTSTGAAKPEAADDDTTRANPSSKTGAKETSEEAWIEQFDHIPRERVIKYIPIGNYKWYVACSTT